MQEIVPGVFVETRYAPYNVGVIATGDYAIAVDMPPCPSEAEQWCNEAQQAAGPIRYVVITDHSPERLAGAANAQRPIIATEATLRHLNSYEDRAWRDLMHQVATHYADEASLIQRLSIYRIAIAFGDRFHFYSAIGPLEFESVSDMKPGALWLTLPQQRLLFAGDSVTGNVPPLVAQMADLKIWMQQLEHLQQRQPVQHIVPGRGNAAILRGEIEQQREFLRVMRHTALTLTQRGHGDLSISQTAQDLGQTFFNSMGQKAVKQIKQGLLHLMEKLQAAQQSPPEEEETDDDLVE